MARREGHIQKYKGGIIFKSRGNLKKKKKKKVEATCWSVGQGQQVILLEVHLLAL